MCLQDEIRSQIAALAADMLNEREKFTSVLGQVEKYRDARREMDRIIDAKYQRKM